MNIQYYNRHRENSTLKKSISELAEIKRDIIELNSDNKVEKLLLFEARARKIYYGCFDIFINKDGFEFNSRTRNPPLNEINAMISFGNVVLYNLIATEIGKTALDVRVGFLHSTSSRKHSLNLDIAEIFKPIIVDRTIFSLINKGMIKRNTHFETLKSGAVYLSPQGKSVFLKAFYQKMDSVTEYDGEPLNYNRIIVQEIRKLIRHFKKGDDYFAFKVRV